MQPARAEVVQSVTVPASAATASARRGAMMSIPSWLPWPRGSPKSLPKLAWPTTGKTIVWAAFAVGPPLFFAPGSFGGPAAAAPVPRAARRVRKRTPRAVVRWRSMRLRFALEAPYPSSPRLCPVGQPAQNRHSS